MINVLLIVHWIWDAVSFHNLWLLGFLQLMVGLMHFWVTPVKTTVFWKWIAVLNNKVPFCSPLPFLFSFFLGLFQQRSYFVFSHGLRIAWIWNGDMMNGGTLLSVHFKRHGSVEFIPRHTKMMLHLRGKFVWESTGRVAIRHIL